MSRCLSLSALALSLCLSACSDPNPDANLVLEDDTPVDSKADGVPRPRGMFDGGASDYFEWLQLNADGTYWWQNPVDNAIGRYHFAKRGAQRFLVLDENAAGTSVQRYEYTFHAPNLAVRRTGEHEWASLVHTGSLNEGCAYDPESPDWACDPGLHCDQQRGCVPPPTP